VCGEWDRSGAARLLLDKGAVRVLDAGDIAYFQGDDASDIFYVLSGWFKLHHELPDGRCHVSRFVTTGAVLGLSRRQKCYSQNATAITAASICVIPVSSAEALRHAHPKLDAFYLEALREELDHNVDELTILGQGTAIERVAHLLWDAATAKSGSAPLTDGFKVKLPLTQRLIGEATGLTAIHVNRVLRRLREKNVVELRDGLLTVGAVKNFAACGLIGRVEGRTMSDTARSVGPDAGQRVA
jgi:CRP-like cAMP-binding protein